MKKFVIGFLILLVLFGCAGHSDNISSDVIYKLDIPYKEFFSIVDKNIEEYSWPIYSVNLDLTYFIIKSEYIEDIVDQYRKDNYDLTYISEMRDCDDIAIVFKAWFIKKYGFELGAKHQNASPILTLIVEQVNSFGGVNGSDNYHAVVGIMTDIGLIIYEPSGKIWAHINDYPNREHIKYMWF